MKVSVSLAVGSLMENIQASNADAMFWVGVVV
jgi:hypothetical protein